jgi:uncharacterized membrane protein
MYKNFFVFKSMLNILLIGLAHYFLFFDKMNYIIALLIIIVITQILYKIISITKFKKEAVKDKNYIALNIVMILAIWASMYFNRFFLVLSWLVYTFTEILNYNNAKDYFE